jgi:uncharacterized protein HemX
VLARLNQIVGVEYSFVNASGTLIRLSLLPGADPDRVAEEAQRVLNEQVEDGVPEQLSGAAASAPLHGEEWQDTHRLAELAATQMGFEVSHGPWLLLALLLACVAAGLGLLWWWRRRHRRAELQRLQAYLHQHRQRLQAQENDFSIFWCS